MSEEAAAAMTDDITPEDADEEMLKLGPDDVIAMIEQDERGELSPVWRAALARARKAGR